MKSHKIQFQKRDHEIFKFLWTWKLSTTKAIAERFFDGSISDTAYNRLILLKKSGFIESLALDTAGWRFVWVLTPRGFRALRNELGDLKEDGFRSENLEHDLYVGAAHLGDWLKSVPHGVEFFSEQELRRLPLEKYPAWVPKTDSRRPDGYWYVPYKGKHLVVGLEVELNSKIIRRYEVLARFYSDNPTIFRVIWIVPSLGIAQSIQATFKNETKSHLIHDFVTRKDFEKYGWNAHIALGHEQSKPFSFVLGVRDGISNGAMQGSCSCMMTALMDTRKRPGNSQVCAKTTESHFGNRMANPTNKANTTNMHQALHIHVHTNGPTSPNPKTSSNHKQETYL